MITRERRAREAERKAREAVEKQLADLDTIELLTERLAESGNAGNGRTL
jgi:hypothetical protein